MMACERTAREEARRRHVLLGALCFSTLLVNSNANSVAPFLLSIAQDLQTDLAATSNLVSLSSLSWGVASLAAGTASDRFGRRPLLMAGLIILACSTVGVALAGSFLVAAAWRLITGIGGGAFMGTVFAAVADQFPSAERGRALGWVVTGMSLSLVFGVPVITLVGAALGWRGALISLGVAVLATSWFVWLVIPKASSRRAERRTRPVEILKVLTPRIVALLAAGTMERVCYASVVVFLATFLLTSYEMTFQELAIALGLVAVGNLVGNVVGSQLTDRLPSRLPLAIASMVVTGLLALPLLLWQPGAAISTALGLAYSFANALSRPPLLASLSEVSSEARGSVLGLNITFSSFGWLGASGLGGWLIVTHGFSSLGLLGAASGVAGGLLAGGSWLAARRTGSV